MEQSDRVVVLDLGTVLATGLPEEIQRNQAVRDAYLGEGEVNVDGEALTATPPTHREPITMPKRPGHGLTMPPTLAENPGHGSA